MAKVTVGRTSRSRGFLSRASDLSGIIQMPSLASLLACVFFISLK